MPFGCKRVYIDRGSAWTRILEIELNLAYCLCRMEGRALDDSKTQPLPPTSDLPRRDIFEFNIQIFLLYITLRGREGLSMP